MRRGRKRIGRRQAKHNDAALSQRSDGARRSNRGATSTEAMGWTTRPTHPPTHAMMHTLDHLLAIDRSTLKRRSTPNTGQAGKAGGAPTKLLLPFVPASPTTMREQEDTATAGTRRRRPLLLVGGLAMAAAAIVVGQQADCAMAAAAVEGGRRQCGFLPAAGGAIGSSSRLMGVCVRMHVNSHTHGIECPPPPPPPCHIDLLTSPFF